MWPSMRSWTNTVDHLLDDPLAAKIRSSSNVEAIFSTLETDNNMKSIKDNPELLPIVLRNILFKHLVYIEGTHPYKVWMLDDIPRLVEQAVEATQTGQIATLIVPADMAWSVLKAIMQFGVDRGLLSHNPCQGGKSLWRGSRRDQAAR